MGRRGARDPVPGVPPGRSRTSRNEGVRWCGARFGDDRRTVVVASGSHRRAATHGAVLRDWESRRGYTGKGWVNGGFDMARTEGVIVDSAHDLGTTSAAQQM